jgi:hypothetical protein
MAEATTATAPGPSPDQAAGAPLQRCHGCKGDKPDVQECRTTVQIGNGTTFIGPTVDCTIKLCERCYTNLDYSHSVGFTIQVPAKAGHFRRRSK